MNTFGKESVVVTHPGRQHSYETALALQQVGLLHSYLTGFYYKPEVTLTRVLSLSKRLEREMRRRYRIGLEVDLVRMHPWRELTHVMLARWRPFGSHAGQIVRWRNRHFDRFTARFVMKTRPSAVICYDTCAEQTQKAAKSIESLCILDQTIGHWRSLSELARQESELHPEFADSMPVDLPPSFLESCTAEGLQADCVLVASQYVKDTMVAHGVDPDRVTILPYGVDVDRFKPKSQASTCGFRVLFVGQITQRKGIKYLLEAVRQLKIPRLSLTVVGCMVGSGKGLIPYRDYFEHVHYVPYDQVHRYFQEADLFVYPSLHEGSALAIYEALASGLPVITTPNSGSVVRDGVDGFIVPIRDIESLKNRIFSIWQNREMRIEMGRNARWRSKQFTWAAYRTRLGGLLQRWLGMGDHSQMLSENSNCAGSLR